MWILTREGEGLVGEEVRHDGMCPRLKEAHHDDDLWTLTWRIYIHNRWNLSAAIHHTA